MTPTWAALYAEALMDLRPWDLWTHDGQPQPGTDEIIRLLDSVLAKEPDHPLALHLYVHANEASPNPGRADSAADRLRDLEPGLAHLVHMPSHIDVRRGRWKEAERANEKAIAADENYRKIRPNQGFYRIYMLHNRHMLAFAAVMRGESGRAIRAIDEMIAAVPPRLGTRKRGARRRCACHAARASHAIRPLGRGPRGTRAGGDLPDRPRLPPRSAGLGADGHR